MTDEATRQVAYWARRVRELREQGLDTTEAEACLAAARRLLELNAPAPD